MVSLFELILENENVHFELIGVNTIYYRWKLEWKGLFVVGDKAPLPDCCLGFSVALSVAVSLLID